jgi:hypothetical protein
MAHLGHSPFNCTRCNDAVDFPAARYSSDALSRLNLAVAEISLISQTDLAAVKRRRRLVATVDTACGRLLRYDEWLAEVFDKPDA